MSGQFITVTNLNDSGAGSLRQAILDVDGSDPLGAYITFDSSLSGGTINLTNRLAIQSDEEVRIYGDIDGDGVSDITVTGDQTGNGHVFVLNAGYLRIDDLTIERFLKDGLGNPEEPPAYISSPAYIIGNTGTMQINDSVIANTRVYGAASNSNGRDNALTVSNLGGMTITNTLFENNYASSAENEPGVAGVYNSSIGTLSIVNTGFIGTARGGPNGGDAVVGVYNNGDLSGSGSIGVNGDSLVYPGAGGDGVIGLQNNGTGTLTVGETGTSGDDTLSGGGEGTAKLILGFGGDDIIASGNENDTIFGGAGDDFFSTGSDLGSNTNAVRIYGDAGDDRISVYDANGIHTFSGGRGVDTLSFLNAGDVAAGIAINLNTTAAQTVDANLTATITGIENLVGTINNDLLTGDDQANILNGLFGKDTINGGGGDDTISGGYGGSLGDPILLTGGAGADVFKIQAGESSVTGAGGEGSIDEDADTLSFEDITTFGVEFTLQLDGARQDFRADAGEAFVTISQIENVRGSQLGDTLTGATFEANLIEGGDGADILNAASAGDTLNGGAGNDTLNGTGARDLLLGGGDNDRLLGGGNADTLQGGDGADVLIGGNGVDNLLGGAQNDRIFGGGGNDRMSGGGGRDVMNGGGGGDVMTGDLGADRLTGAGGRDRLTGGGDRDILSGGGDNDILLGGLGSDRLLGGLGADRLTAGAGADTLTGGGGADQFIFAPRQGVNLVTDFRNGVDKIKLSGVANFGQLSVSEAQGDTVIRFKQTVIRLDGVDSDLIDGRDFIFARRAAEKPEQSGAAPAPDDDPLTGFFDWGADDLL